MDTHAFHVYLCTCSIEVLEFQFTNISTIHRVSPFTAELLHVEMMGSHTNLFVRIKGDADVTVLYFRMVT